MNGGVINSVVLDPTDPATLYAGTLGGVFKSNDGGTTWAYSSTGMDSIFDGSLLYAGSTLYAGTKDGVYNRTDRGATWTTTNGGLKKKNKHTFASSGTALNATTYLGETVYK